jgi:hypothetical protein
VIGAIDAAAHSLPGRSGDRHARRELAAPEVLRLVGVPLVTRERSGGGPRLGCCLRLERVQDVEGALADLARDGEGGRVCAGVAVVAAVELVVGAGRAARVLGGLDERPAQIGRSLLGEVSATALVGRLPDDGVKAGGADDLARAAEPGRVADLGQDGAREVGPIP